MAHRIEGAVVWGEIDNTTEGITTGRLWMLGHEQPVRLDLVGDCWRDLAGTRLTFRNPHPREAAALFPLQRGLVGDMTASRKSRVPLCGPCECLEREARGEEVPAVWKNLLSLEWFSEKDGRVMIESTDFDLHLSERVWSMDEDAEEAQKLANLQAMRDFLASLTGRDPAGGPDGERLTDAYQEILGKYTRDHDAEQKEAFVMGWDRLLGDMAEAYEQHHRHESPSVAFAMAAVGDLSRRSQRLLRHMEALGADHARVTPILATVAEGLSEIHCHGKLTGTEDLQAGLRHCLDLLAEILRRSDPGNTADPTGPLLRELTFLIEGLIDLLGNLRGS
jgi:hypothetical protein